MRNTITLILLAIMMLISASLVCTWFGKKDEPSENLPSAEQSVESAAPAKEPLSATEALQVASNAHLKNEYRSEVGGYAFQPVIDYKMEEFFGLASMVAPDADPGLGPMLMLIGGANEVKTTEEEIFNEFIQDAEGEDITILDSRKITVDGKPGILADIGGEVNGQQVVGRIVVVAVTPTQQFTMFASAPVTRWAEIENLFSAVLGSVHFFEPAEIDFSESIDE